jgi:hypothetical protein
MVETSAPSSGTRREHGSLSRRPCAGRLLVTDGLHGNPAGGPSGLFPRSRSSSYRAAGRGRGYDRTCRQLPDRGTANPDHDSRDEDLSLSARMDHRDHPLVSVAGRQRRHLDGYLREVPRSLLAHRQYGDHPLEVSTVCLGRHVDDRADLLFRVGELRVRHVRGRPSPATPTILPSL